MKSLLINFLALISCLSTYSQSRLVSGTVTDQAGMPLPAVNILVVGTISGTQTDDEGKYTIEVEESQVLRFSFLGFETQEVLFQGQDVINVTMLEDVSVLEEVVVTALGIEREKKSLGYATQEIEGESVSGIKTQNFVNSLSGKVAGLVIKPSGTIGGSTNVVIRGNSSIQGNNQALFVIDGIPINNDTGNF